MAAKSRRFFGPNYGALLWLLHLAQDVPCTTTFKYVRSSTPPQNVITECQKDGYRILELDSQEIVDDFMTYLAGETLP